jgi:spermidine synthase
MTRPWKTLARAESRDGPFELRRRGESDFLITVSGRVLMNAHANRSERALAEHTCDALGRNGTPRVLIGGLGMGCTLCAALERLPALASVEVCELHAFIAEWCRGPLAELNRNALADPRVRVTIGDVAARIGTAEPGSLDAIVLDLLEGPHARTHPTRDPFYGSRALAATRRALAPGGHLAIWSEARDEAYEARLAAGGFETTWHRPGRGGLRHAVYLSRVTARRPAGRRRGTRRPTGARPGP